MKAAWHIVEPDVVFVDGWHIRAICQYLEAIYKGEIPDNRLIINVPPRHMKSLLVNVMFPAWVWTKRPSKKFLLTSYGEGMIAEHAGKCRKLVNSSWYQERFNVEMSAYPDTNLRFANIHGGYVYSFGFGGSITGQGGDFIIIDDPLKSTDADSDLIRQKANNDFDNAVSNRLNDPKTGAIIIIMQRLHELDLVGHIQQEKKLNYEHLILPAEYEGVRFESSIGFVDPRTEAGELLWGERFGEKEIASAKITLTERGVAGQLQQRPAPAGGFIYKKIWFNRLHDNNNVAGIYISWDTAESVSPDAAYSCGVVGELTNTYHLFIREVVRKRLLFPQLQEEIENLALKYKELLSAVVIEKKSTGGVAIQTLRQESPQWLAEKIYGFDPKGDKVARATVAASWAERQCILLPHPSDKFPWLKDYEDEIFMFPSSAFKDQTDATSQLILYLRSYLSEGWRARTNTMFEVQSLDGVL